jgi:hypothetical protein
LALADQADNDRPVLQLSGEVNKDLRLMSIDIALGSHALQIPGTLRLIKDKHVLSWQASGPNPVFLNEASHWTDEDLALEDILEQRHKGIVAAQEEGGGFAGLAELVHELKSNEGLAGSGHACNENEVSSTDSRGLGNELVQPREELRDPRTSSPANRGKRLVAEYTAGGFYECGQRRICAAQPFVYVYGYSLSSEVSQSKWKFIDAHDSRAIDFRPNVRRAREHEDRLYPTIANAV